MYLISQIFCYYIKFQYVLTDHLELQKRDFACFLIHFEA